MRQILYRYLKFVLAAVLSLCMVFGSVSVITATKAETNLITNGDFETYNSDSGKFEGWNHWNGNTTKDTIERADGRIGGNSLVAKNLSQDHIPSVSTSFSVEAGKDYRVIAYIKTGSSDEVTWNCPSWAKGVYFKVSATGMTDVKSEAVKTANRWQRLSFIVTDDDIPDDITNLKFSLIMEYTKGLIYIDDISITEYTGGELEPEVLEDMYNTDFEDVKGTIIEDWNKTIPNSTTAINPTSADGEVYSGDYAVKFTSSNRNNVFNLSQKINNIDYTKRYVLTCYIKSDELDVAYQGGGIKLRVVYTDALGSTVNVTSKALTTTTEWTQHKLYFQIPEGAKDVTARIFIDCVKGNVFCDKLNLEVIGNAITVEPEKFANAGFEEFYDGEFPEWSFYNGGNANNSVTQKDGRNGYAAVLTDTNTDHIVYFSQSVDLDRTKDYRISFYVMAKSVDGLSVYVPSWGGAYIRASAGDYKVESEKITAAGRYKKLSVIVKGSELPEDTNTVKVQFILQYLRGTFYIDDASIVEYNGEPDEPEILEDLYNVGFENWEANTPDDWTKNIPNSTVNVTPSTDKKDGSKSLLFTSTNRNNVANVNQVINNIDPAYRYCLTAFAKTLGKPNVAYQGGGVKLRVQYKDSEGNTVSVSSSGMRELNDWTKLKLYFQIPENAKDIRAVLMIDCVEGKVLFDSVALEKVGNAIASQKGNFANGDFEIFYDGEFPEWKFSNGGNNKNSITQEKGRTGKAAVIRDTNTDHILSLSQSVELDRSKNYKISFYVRPTSDDDTGFYVPSWGGAFIQLSAGDYVTASEVITSTSRYRKLSLIVNGSDLPENTSTVNISFVMKYMRGIIHLDDAVIVEYNGEADEPDKFDDLYNLSFEEGKNDSFEDWNKSVPNNTVKITASSDAYDAKRSVLFTSGDRNNVATMYQSINNWDSAFRYRITVYAKTLIKPDVAYDGGGVKLRVSYVDQNGETQNLSSAGKRELNDWTRLYVDYQIPKGAKDVRAVLMIDCFAGKVVFDKVAIEKIGKAVVMPVQDPNNKAPNFSFENGQDGAFAGWYWWTQSQKIQCVAGEPRSGAQSAKIISETQASNSMLSVDTSGFDTTKWYQFSAWVKTKDVKPLVAGEGGVRIKMDFKQPGGNSTLKTYSSKSLFGDNDWTLLTVIGKFPANCKRVVFGLSFSQASGTVWFDDIDIREIEYIDTNILPNGSFDEFSDDGSLLYWESDTEDWSYASFMADSGAAQVENSGYTTSYYYQELTLDYRQNYILSGSVKSSYMVSEDGGAATLVEFIDVYGNVIETKRCNDYISEGSDGWIDFCTLLTFPEGCKKMRIMLANVNGVGEASFKDFTLYEEDDYLGDRISAAGADIKNLNAPASASVKYVKPAEVKTKTSIGPIIGISAGVAVILCAAVVLVIIIRKKKLSVK